MTEHDEREAGLYAAGVEAQNQAQIESAEHAEHKARMRRLAGEMVECPRLHDDTWFTPCPSCGESSNGPRGKVYLLPDSVRVPCDSIRETHLQHVFSKTLGDAEGNEIPCPNCHDLGYTPATDMATWGQAIGALLEQLYSKNERGDAFFAWQYRYQAKMGMGDLPAALEAAEKALVAAGAMEKEKL